MDNEAADVLVTGDVPQGLVARIVLDDHAIHIDAGDTFAPDQCILAVQHEKHGGDECKNRDALPDTQAPFQASAVQQGVGS